MPQKATHAQRGTVPQALEFELSPLQLAAVSTLRLARKLRAEKDFDEAVKMLDDGMFHFKSEPMLLASIELELGECYFEKAIELRDVFAFNDAIKWTESSATRYRSLGALGTTVETGRAFYQLGKIYYFRNRDKNDCSLAFVHLAHASNDLMEAGAEENLACCKLLLKAMNRPRSVKDIHTPVYNTVERIGFRIAIHRRIRQAKADLSAKRKG